MIETKYKSADELRYSIGEGKQIGILSCGACANLCDIGGVRGMEFIRKQVEQWGNTVVAKEQSLPVARCQSWHPHKKNCCKNHRSICSLLLAVQLVSNQRFYVTPEFQ